MLWEDAARLAEADQRTGRNSTGCAEAELALHHEAEAAEARRGHAAWDKGRSGSSSVTARPKTMIRAPRTAMWSVPTVGYLWNVDGASPPRSCPHWTSTPR